ncbi:hypothetical protein RRU94_17130 [Domibacillus sp. DTU_2020_1001157_1_SI_ALB_TIR_016]|uniref:hypothetical protein n=1 Tax=Domibacillus sp. DTU_2020_1001157_1_SI_ALB_TIR_016 TaxID=3077789 RepID=UPI0028E2BFCD|nr:hypothetical protein [Domibacillus sp. DTU_2020_1001157_1_SI_ALB_TIR_016]WNS79274.1 hypothetical protein RRU94_17130 [Domibacillus sp. DTU_2020_1001157_1_SI_ALB_TIR_016]
MKNKGMVSVLSVGLVAGALYYSNTGNHVEANQQTDTQVKIETAADQSPIENTAEEKEKLQRLMLNSIDHFKTVKGSFEYFAGAPANFHYLVTYQADLSDQPKSYEKVQTIKGDAPYASSLMIKDKLVLDYESSLYDGEFHVTISDQGNGKPKIHTEKAVPVNEQEYNQWKNTGMKERTGIFEDDGEPFSIHRADPAYMGVAKTAVLPEDAAMVYMKNINEWEITGEGSHLGRNTVIVKGQAENRDFEAEVDRETGILLKLQVKNSEGTVKDTINMLEIQVDKKLNDELFMIQH